MKTKPQKFRLRTLLIGVGLFVVGLVAALALVLLNAVVTIPKPSGPHAVGFRSTTLTDPSRTMTIRGQTSPRVVTLDTWYPATSVVGLTAEPYQDKLLAQLLAKYQNIPDVAASEPSYSFIAAPMLPGAHPVIVFNHGYSSYTKQNFSNMQELASQGYLVISVGHPTESLVAKDAQGNAIEFNPDSREYVAYKQAQSNPKAFATALGAGMAKQRSAHDAASHQLASQELSTLQPYVDLQALLNEWVLDTRLVISNLSSLPEADATRVTLMGHSFGGVTSLEIAKDPPPGVIGVINLDGPWVRYGADERPLQLPLLAFLSTENKLEGQDLGMHGTFDVVLKAGTQPAHVIEIAGTAHNNFTDLSYVQLLKYISPILGSVDVKDITRWQNEATLEFLHRLEKGNMPPPLLPADARINQRYFAAK
jgi:dienelactone hydrolase